MDRKAFWGSRMLFSGSDSTNVMKVTMPTMNMADVKVKAVLASRILKANKNQTVGRNTKPHAH